ncbi:nmrA-like family protein [Aspergillus sclerotiicarbonarius CBS 121057]|uniref:NmrA-like family protein n=1 Tax=Aspergillus sclerotiicarbonarius (strain CBS 121057 / IBT 28362) TaxID=1448318 RepID=A0A319DRG8_ASPSB|nr:nmrA-like family protein [Aspergillus sclerotiicarbonarius CBS 121057]
MKVGIAGITGKFARLLATHLLAQEASIKGYCRTPSKVPEAIRSSPRVELIQGEAFDREAVRSFVQGCDVVVCCYLGDDKLMVDGQKLLIDACDELQVTRYVASDWALDYTKLQLGQLFPKDPMIHVKAYLKTKANVAGVHVLIGGFMEPVLSPFFDILDPSTMTFRYWGEGDEVMEGTTYDDAARYTAAVTLDPIATGLLRFVGGRASIRDIARSFEKVYGVKPTLERRGSLDDFFFYYYWINGQTFVGPQLDNARYPDINPVDWEGYMSKWPIDKLPTSYFALGM